MATRRSPWEINPRLSPPGEISQVNEGTALRVTSSPNIEAPLVGVLVGGANPLPSPEWKESTTNKWVISVIRGGLELQFQSQPPLTSVPLEPVELHKGSGKAQSSFGRNILHGDQKSYRGSTGAPGEFSRVLLPSFSCEKRRPGWRPVIDLSILNRYLVIPHFKMETYRSIRASVSQDMWTTSLDLTDAYFYIQIAPCRRHFLCFALMGKFYAFNAPPFGLAIARFGFHQNHAGAFRPSAFQGHQSTRLSGRFSRQSGDLPGSFIPHYVCTRYSPQYGVFWFHGKSQIWLRPRISFS